MILTPVTPHSVLGCALHAGARPPKRTVGCSFPLGKLATFAEALGYRRRCCRPRFPSSSCFLASRGAGSSSRLTRARRLASGTRSHWICSTCCLAVSSDSTGSPLDCSRSTNRCCTSCCCFRYCVYLSMQGALTFMTRTMATLPHYCTVCIAQRS